MLLPLPLVYVNSRWDRGIGDALVRETGRARPEEDSVQQRRSQPRALGDDDDTSVKVKWLRMLRGGRASVSDVRGRFQGGAGGRDRSVNAVD